MERAAGRGHAHRARAVDSAQVITEAAAARNKHIHPPATCRRGVSPVSLAARGGYLLIQNATGLPVGAAGRLAGDTATDWLVPANACHTDQQRHKAAELMRQGLRAHRGSCRRAQAVSLSRLTSSRRKNIFFCASLALASKKIFSLRRVACIAFSEGAATRNILFQVR